MKKSEQFEAHNGVVNCQVEARMYIPALVLAFLPLFSGYIYISYGIIYTNVLRLNAFDLYWILFSLLIFVVALAAGAPFSDQFRNLRRSTFVLFAVFSLVLIYTSTIVAIKPPFAVHESLLVVTAVIVGLSAVSLKRRYGVKFLDSISWSIFAAMLLHIPLLVWLYFLEGDNPDFQWSLRLPGFTGVRPYNYMLEAGIAAGTGLYYVHDNMKRSQNLVLFTGVSLLWAALFWSGGRGAFFALILTFILAGILSPANFRRLLKFVLITAILGAAISYKTPSPHKDFGFANRFENTVDSGSLNSATSGRIAMWSEAYELFKEKPIFGNGISQYAFMTKNPKFIVHRHVHNIFFDALMSFGIVGTAALLVLFGRAWLTAVFRVVEGKIVHSMPMFLIATTLLTHAFVSGTYFHVHSQILIAISLGLLLPGRARQ